MSEISLYEKPIEQWNFVFLENMRSKEDILNFLSDNRPFFEKEFNIIRIGLFGSYSRGDETDDSDIDLVVEFEENTQDLYEKKTLLKEFIRKNLGVETDICREKYIKPRFKSAIIRETQYAYQGPEQA